MDTVLSKFNLEVFSNLIVPNPAQNAGFCAVNPQVFELNESQFLVYMTLLKFRNREGFAFLRGKTVSMTERNIQRVLKELESKGFIKKLSIHQFFIEIASENGKLFKKYTRWFVNSLNKRSYLEFRAALFFGYHSKEIGETKAVELRKALKCRCDSAATILKELKEKNTTISHIKSGIRFIYTPYQYSNEKKTVLSENNEPIFAKKPITPMVNDSDAQDKNELNSFSHASHISSLKNKKELTMKSESILVSNFEKIGMPSQEISATSIDENKPDLSTYQEILTPEEINFLMTFLSIIWKQKSFTKFDENLRISHTVNLLLSIKTKKFKTKLLKTPFEYFCGSLIGSLNSNQELNEITRAFNRINEVNESRVKNEKTKILQENEEKKNEEFDSTILKYCREKFKEWKEKSNKEIDVELKLLCLKNFKKYEEILIESGISKNGF